MGWLFCPAAATAQAEFPSRACRNLPQNRRVLSALGQVGSSLTQRELCAHACNPLVVDIIHNNTAVDGKELPLWKRSLS